MPNNPLDPKSSSPGGLQGMLARLRGMVKAANTPAAEPAEEDVLPTWDLSPGVAAPAPAAEPEPPSAETAPAAEPFVPPTVDIPPPPPPPLLLCPLCQSPRKDGHSYCDDCGFIFPPDAPPAAVTTAPAMNSARIQGRYQLGEKVSERGGVARFRGLDFGNDAGGGTPVIILRSTATAPPEAFPAAEEVVAVPVEEAGDEVLPSFDEPAPAAVPITDTHPLPAIWPGLAWEKALLENAKHPTLPAVLDHFQDEGHEYLVEEVTAGQPLWDYWDAPETTFEERFLALKQVAEALHALHHAGALLEALRPDIVIVTPSGQAKLTDLSDLLPLPVPPDVPIRATLYTAPELAAYSPEVDARADLYSFGAMLYALHVGRELTENDFERPGFPKPFVPRFPDVHPLFGRLMAKTFCRDPKGRFPTEEAVKEDPSGFAELIRTLDVCRRTLDQVRLEIASWTTTGMIRTGNEDAFALLHAAESRQDDLGESALVLLCDGMGGYEAGEVAAALAIQALRKNLLQQKPFAALNGQPIFPPDGQKADAAEPLDIEACKKLLQAALKEANKFVYTASRSGVGRRGMGCTAEVVFVDGRHVVVGHVGDSRTYHLQEGRLLQLTRDQTLVNRLVELGTLTAEEAENHPRKNELQQAIGGQPDVEPGVYHSILRPGDWVVVCSDGVSNHVTPDMLKEMLQVEATSAEMAARRLVNLVNIEGATDNATVVVIRAT